VHADAASPSPFFETWREAIRDAGRLGPALDLACGRGRHARATAALGVPCLAIDRDAQVLASLEARALPAPLLRVRADVEAGLGIPVRPGTCGVVLVFCFLFRPLAAAIAECLRPGGLLLYETFTVRQRDTGRGPRNPAFLLEPGELPRLFPGLAPLACEEGWRGGASASHLASLAARKPAR
jgi:SAM-dependent methyltransferase